LIVSNVILVNESGEGDIKESRNAVTDPEVMYVTYVILYTHGAPRSSQEPVQKCSCIPGSHWDLKMLFFEERGKPEYPEKNLSEQSRKPTTNSTNI